MTSFRYTIHNHPYAKEELVAFLSTKPYPDQQKGIAVYTVDHYAVYDLEHAKGIWGSHSMDLKMEKLVEALEVQGNKETYTPNEIAYVINKLYNLNTSIPESAGSLEVVIDHFLHHDYLDSQSNDHYKVAYVDFHSPTEADDSFEHHTTIDTTDFHH